MDQRLFSKLRCQVIDLDEARTETHREVLLAMCQVFDTDGAVVLCVPSVVGGRSGPPDIAIVDPESGVHIVEVKGISLPQVKSVLPGGAIEIAYESRTSRKDPSRQAKQSMFDVKDAASRHFGGDLNIGFESWVVFPRIRRREWEDKFGELVSSRADVLFLDDLESSSLGDRLRASGRRRLHGVGAVPAQQMQSVMAAFGDSAALAQADRSRAAPTEGSLCERLSDGSAEHRVLTEQQQRLVMQGWDDGPRLVRGVAGSGKTIVLATQVARMIERIRRAPAALFDAPRAQPRLLVVCFNRTLVPFIRDRIEAAYRQRTCEGLPHSCIEVLHFNKLMWSLARQGLVQYRRVEHDQDPGERAQQYLQELNANENRLGAGLFHATFVDEGQDFHEDEYRVLLRLSGRTTDESPRMFVFYDDAQNLYGRVRPTWSDLGIDVRGRAVVMDESFRNTRQIIEPAFNVLVGSYAKDSQRIGTRSFADLATLKDKDRVVLRGAHFVVKFARRQGDPVRLTCHDDALAESIAIAARTEELLQQEGLLPHDIAILAFRRERARALADELTKRLGAAKVHSAFEGEAKDQMAIQRDKVTVSTIASVKGYDTPYVILASANEFVDDVEGRAAFYVGCTRARDWLDVSCYGESAIVSEFKNAVAGVA